MHTNNYNNHNAIQKHKKKFLCFFISILVLATLMWISTWNQILLSKLEFFAEDQHRSVSLPFSENYLGAYKIRLELSNNQSSSQQFHITPDDELVSLSVNGEAVSLEHISLDKRRNYSAGFFLTLNNLKLEQANRLEFGLNNSSNPTGFNLKTSQRCSKLQLLAIFCVLAFYALCLTRHLKISGLQKLFFIMTIAMAVLYLSKTDERTRTFDVFEGGGHYDYIDYIVKNHALPNPGGGWEYHQPPLYYLSAALLKSAAGISDSNYLWAQLLGLFFWCIFLASSLACLKIGFRKLLLPLAISSFALCFWPAGIIHSIRIGNDLPLYAFSGLAFFYTLKWWYSHQSAALCWASIWMAAAMLTKSNGLIAAATLGLLFICHLYLVARKPARLRRQKTKAIKDTAVAGSLFFLALSLNFGDNVYCYLNGTSSDWLLANVGSSINSGLKVNNSLNNYLIFDLSTFLQNPFISTWEDIYGRQYFLNFLWRSSLTSEFFFHGELMDYWGIANGVLLLVAIAGACIYVLQKQPAIHFPQLKVNLYYYLPWLLTLILPFMFLLAYRIKAPVACNTDFRYIYPVLVSLLFFTALVWREPKKFPIPALLSLAIIFIGGNSFVWIAYL